MELVMLALIIIDLALSVGLSWLVARTLKDERARSDRFAAALLHTANESRAAVVVSSPDAAKAKADPRHRPQQIGLSPR